MKQGTAFRSILLAISAVAMASLACGAGLTPPTPPASPIVVSTEAAGELETIWQDAIENAENGEVTVVMTEQQLTSYVALQLAKNPDSNLSDVQIFLRDGSILTQASATIGGVKAPVQIGFKVETTAEGRLAVTVDEAALGPVPVPASVLNTLSDGLNEVVSGELGPQATGFRITGVVIADGQMSVTGSITR